MHDIKRNIDEVLSIYLLEKDFVDIYVEGPTDRSIIQNFFEYKQKDTKVVEIDSLDFSKYRDIAEGLDLRSNKNKLIIFSRLLLENNVRTNINCIVDRDFDGLINNIEKNEYLLYTDYSCMESYIFTDTSIKKILDIGIRNFPFDSKHTLKQITKIMYFLFLMRAANEKLNLNGTLPKIENNLAINKATGVCNFNADNFLEKFINNNKIIPRSQEIKDFIEEAKKEFTDDVRYYMNGHDFILLLFNYINKIKNSINFKLEQFERAVYLSVQPNHLDQYELFKKIS